MIDPQASSRRLSGQVTILFESQSIYDSLIPADHPLRLIKQLVDFSQVRDMVRERRLYSDHSGRYAIDPELFVKLCFLMTYDNVSLRETERRAGTDLCWKFFLDVEVTDPAPFDFTTLSATRKRYGPQTCRRLAEQVLRQAAEAGVLTEGATIIDSASSYADVAVLKTVELVRRICDKLRDAIRPVLPREEAEQLAARHLELRQDNAWYQSLQLKLDHLQQWGLFCGHLAQRAEQILAAPGLAGQLGDWPRHEQRIQRQLDIARHWLEDQEPKPPSRKKDQLASETDPDARHSNRQGDRDKIGYRSHLLMDEDSELILAAEGTPANTDDGTMLPALLDQTLQQGHHPTELLADSAYADGANRERLAEEHIEAFIPQPPPKSSGPDKFKTTEFHYDPQANTVTCPAGQVCARGHANFKKGGQTFNFKLALCRTCPLLERCLKLNPRRGRSIYIPRHRPLLDEARAQQKTARHRQAMKRRLAIERKLAQMLNTLGLRRCRYRGLSRFNEQLQWAVLTVNIMQLAKLLRAREGPFSAAPAVCSQAA